MEITNQTLSPEGAKEAWLELIKRSDTTERGQSNRILKRCRQGTRSLVHYDFHAGNRQTTSQTQLHSDATPTSSAHHTPCCWVGQDKVLTLAEELMWIVIDNFADQLLVVSASSHFQN